jgi:uncharacterized RDD family membrane protein YckC
MAVTYPPPPPPTPPGGYAPPPGYPPTTGYSVPAGARPSGPGRPGVPSGPGGAPLAEFSDRLLAYLLDSLILGAAMAVPMLAVIIGVVLIMGDSMTAGSPQDAVRFLIFEVVFFVVVFPLMAAATYLYFVTLMHRTGQTFGKRVMKIRVVRSLDGGPIDIRAARRRWVTTHLANLIAPYFNWADGLWQLWDQPYRQCLHDKCASTVVVKVAAP